MFCFFAFLIRIQDNSKIIHQPVPLSYCQTQEPIIASDLFIWGGGGGGGGGGGEGGYVNFFKRL